MNAVLFAINTARVWPRHGFCKSQKQQSALRFLPSVPEHGCVFSRAVSAWPVHCQPVAVLASAAQRGGGVGSGGGGAGRAGGGAGRANLSRTGWI